MQMADCDFLKAVLGDELLEQVQQKLNTHNENPDNANAKIKLCNLGTGEYVSKGKYETLEADRASVTKKLEEANALIAQLQSADKSPDLEQLQEQADKLSKQIQQVRIDGCIKSAFIRAGVLDEEYISYKLKEMGSLELDEHGGIKDLAFKMQQLKTNFPRCFAATQQSGRFEGFNPMKDVIPDWGFTKSEIMQMPYQTRLALFSADPIGYKNIMSND